MIVVATYLLIKICSPVIMRCFRSEFLYQTYGHFDILEYYFSGLSRLLQICMNRFICRRSSGFRARATWSTPFMRTNWGNPHSYSTVTRVLRSPIAYKIVQNGSNHPGGGSLLSYMTPPALTYIQTRGSTRTLGYRLKWRG